MLVSSSFLSFPVPRKSWREQSELIGKDLVTCIDQMLLPLQFRVHNLTLPFLIIMNHVPWSHVLKVREPHWWIQLCISAYDLLLFLHLHFFHLYSVFLLLGFLCLLYSGLHEINWPINAMWCHKLVCLYRAQAASDLLKNSRLKKTNKWKLNMSHIMSHENWRWAKGTREHK